ncbi:latent-transforming growth factor beta-binding protein 4-like [Ostrinia furnacalis]|uniref:latent-transforming growth factor beta-binding protein 4-like n=1 Tax=Ostrinia furnacalis TaxID=93504 RepID=UPI001038A742|nr:latent-transforming growth factor beta-binding protein 4-like [Ostrinia furnacalis]
MKHPDGYSDFILNKRDGAWALRMRRHLKSNTELERQLELEARFVYPQSRPRSRRAALSPLASSTPLAPAPLRYRRTSAPHDAPDACEDIDECAERPERCSPGVCINTDGGFACDCDAGFEPSDDGTACIDHRTGMCHRSLVSGRCTPEPWPRRIESSTPALPAHVTK